jgi:hypothetical protein
MNILASAAAVFSLFLILQILIWRLYLPKKQTLGIIKLYLGLLLVFLLAQKLRLFESFSYFQLSLVESFYFTVLYLSVLPNYVILYTLIEGDSPSNLMVLSLEAAGEKGLTKKDFEKIVTNDRFIWNRIKALADGKYIQLQQSCYKITPHGIRYMNLFLIPRFLIGRANYGG